MKSTDTKRKDFCEVDYVNGAFFLIRRQIIDEIGLFDERFFFYSEDEDFCLRVKKHGYKVIFCKSAEIIHYQGISSRSVNRNKTWIIQQLYDNKEKFFRKHYGIVTAKLYRLIFCLTLSVLFVMNIFRSIFRIKVKPPFTSQSVLFHTLKRSIITLLTGVR